MRNGLSFSNLMETVISMEADTKDDKDEGVKGLKLESRKDFPESGSVNIDLGELTNPTTISQIEAVVNHRGYTFKPYSPESFHHDDNLKYVDPEVRTPGADNLVVNGEFLPDTMKQLIEDAHVRVVNGKTKLTRMDKRSIYYVIDDENDIVYKTLLGEGLLVARTPVELGEAIDRLRHHRRYEL